MTKTAPSAEKQVASSKSSKELEMSSFNNNKQSVLTVVKGKTDKKPISVARETDLPSTDKKSNNLTAEAGFSFADNGSQASVTMETELKSAEKNNSVTVETSQQQTSISCSTKRGSPVTVETVTYEVQEYDTLTSIGARFDMAPSELKQLNKLMCSQLYTKQKLLIYAKNFLEAEERVKAQKIADEENLRNLVFLEAPRSRHSSAASCDLLRLRHPSGQQDELSDCWSEKSVDRIVSDIKRNRLRLEAKHVTDGQGVVSGTLLVTTNTIMFDPNVSDRLVIDRGRNPYVMVAPFENVVRLAIVDDIAAMKWQRDSNMPPPEVYHSDHSCASVRELTSSGEVKSSPGFTKKDFDDSCDFPFLTNDQPLRIAEQPVDSRNRGGILIVSNGKKMTDPDSAASDKQHSLETVVPQLDDIYSQSIETVVFDGKGSNELTMNSPDLRGGPLENLQRPGIFAQRCMSDASYNTQYPVGNSFLNGDVFQPSSFPAGNEISPLGHTPNSSVAVGSPFAQTGSQFPRSYEIANGFARQSSFASSLCEKKDSLYVRHQSLSNVVDGGLGAPSKFVPVYSAKCIPRIASNLQRIDTVGSFCIPPGQSYIVDLSWDQFGGMKVEDGFCVSVFDLPPIVDEDARLMEKPDFYIPDDEEGDDLPAESSEESENTNKRSSEVDVAKLLKSADELYKSLDVLIPRPAVRCEDLPWYLCVVIGRPLLGNCGSKAAAPPDSFSMETMKPTYWFSIHRCDVHPLYEFIMTHFPGIYGSEDEVDPAERGMTVLSQNVFKPKHEASVVCQFFLEEEDDGCQILPSFSEESKILEASQIVKLNTDLFPRGKDRYWQLVYSIDRDGTSLQTLYRKMMELSDNAPPCILVIRDSSRTVFGVALTCIVKRSHEYFGNGESFLFSFKDGFKKYSASCINDYYAYGSKDSLCFGASRGKCGLWIDGDLHHGRTQECATYNNDILTLTEDFYIHQFEAWCLI